jgi:hypothetical protein
MKTLDEVGNSVVPQLTEAFDRAGIVKDRATALATFKADHAIYVDDDGVLYTPFEGRKQELGAALTAWRKTSEGEAYTDRRRLPAEEKNPGGIRSKADFPDSKSRVEYINRYGSAQFEALPTTFIAPEECRTRDQYYKLHRSQKAELARQGVTAESFPIGDAPDKTGMSTIPGGKINRAALAKAKAINPNLK